MQVEVNFKIDDKNKRLILESEVISFDMFDTLVERLLYKPSDLFDIVERKFDIVFNYHSNFKQKRIKSETQISNKNNEITTLDEIYLNLESFNDDEKRWLKQLELDLEKRLIKVKNEGKYIYDYAKAVGKYCVLTSDMYLPVEVIKNILNDLGYYFDEYFVSGHEKLSKSNGNMYSMLLDKYKGKKIVHIGDNYNHDILNAKKHKIKTIFLKPNKKYPKTYTLEESLINSYRNYNHFESELENFGYKYFGPFMFGFSKFINKNSIGDVLFLSRDGYFMKKVYNSLYENNESKYFYCSRKSLLLPSLWIDPTFYSLRDRFKWFGKVSWKEFLYRLNLKIELPNIDQNKVYSEDEFFCGSNEQIYNKYLKDEIIKYSKEQYDLIEEYLNSVSNTKNVTIVDIGWFGTMQKNLASVFEEKEFNGLYVGCYSKLQNTSGYIFDIKKNKNDYGYKISAPLYEMLFYTPHGSVLSYYKDINNDIKPKLEDLTDNYISNLKNIEKFQNKCLEFNKDISYFVDIIDNIDNIAMEFVDYYDNPSKEFIKEINKIYISDGIEFKLVNSYKKFDILKLIKIRHSSGSTKYEIKLNCSRLVSYIYCKLRDIKHKFSNRS